MKVHVVAHLEVNLQFVLYLYVVTAQVEALQRSLLFLNSLIHHGKVRLKLDYLLICFKYCMLFLVDELKALY